MPRDIRRSDPGGRISKAQAATPSGQRLVEQILTLTLTEQSAARELAELQATLAISDDSIAAVGILSEMLAEIMADDRVSRADLYRLRVMLDELVPFDLRQPLAARLSHVLEPNAQAPDAAPDDWHRQPITPSQISRINKLNGHVRPGMLQGEAQRLIQQLEQAQPPTGRQMMLLRFLGRTDMVHRGREELSSFLGDAFYSQHDAVSTFNAWLRSRKIPADSADASLVPNNLYAAIKAEREKKPLSNEAILALCFVAFMLSCPFIAIVSSFVRALTAD